MTAGKYDSFIFDLDGTLYLGEKIIENADKTINTLRALNKRLLFVSNKTTGSAGDYMRLLGKQGLTIYMEEIITSTSVIKKYLSVHHKGKRFFAIGEAKFINEIESAGLIFTTNPRNTDILIVTLDRTFNYDKLETAARALENGALFYAANIDDTCPVESGEVLDAGSTISALEKRTHRKLEKHFGKPSVYMIEEIKQKLGSQAGSVLLCGDRCETDILMGRLLGFDTALVSTGVKYFPCENAEPTYHFNSVYDIIAPRLAAAAD